MSVEIKKLENSVVEITLNLEGEEVSKKREEILKNIQSKVEMPGFRKGKTPLSLIEKNFEANIKEELTDELLKANYENIIVENNLKPVDYLKTVEVKLEEDKFHGVFTVEVFPEVELGEYKGLEVTKEDVNVTDEVVEKEIESMVEADSKLEDAEDDYTAQIGDTVNIDFEGFLDGVAFEGGKGENYPLSLGSKTFIDNFEEQLVGYKKGQEGEINVTFPESYFKPELAGKPVTFKVKLNSIKKNIKPELNDEFAKAKGYDSVEDLKVKKREEIENREKTRVENEFRNKVVDAAVNNATVAVPSSMVAKETEARIRDFENQLKMQGATLEMYMQMSGLTKDGLLSQLKPLSENKVKSDLVLGKIAEIENVEVNEEELSTKIDEIAAMYNMETEKLIEELTKAKTLENFKENLKIDLQIQKTIDLLVENVK
ncbi:trigger factor [Hypnocyclicus thermotrophus]|uniref:Trigger factor n=1 Tax=Hypnocyclicus thermotrophus TaxID=1627895 RepID=A0AA46DYJ8_9FUSO|nr:trigger factor [Hypnocyclicus thermotrophus]TDT70481.1 trigger factor [Hypnocyclicus thermotrophus]